MASAAANLSKSSFLPPIYAFCSASAISMPRRCSLGTQSEDFQGSSLAYEIDSFDFAF
jgi:hypothetical protein